MADDLKLVYEISADNCRSVGSLGDRMKRLAKLERAAPDRGLDTRNLTNSLARAKTAVPPRERE